MRYVAETSTLIKSWLKWFRNEELLLHLAGEEVYEEEEQVGAGGARRG